jgi:hypothetical protein
MMKVVNLIEGHKQKGGNTRGKERKVWLHRSQAHTAAATSDLVEDASSRAARRGGGGTVAFFLVLSISNSTCTLASSVSTTYSICLSSVT